MADLLLEWLEFARDRLNQRGYSVKAQAIAGEWQRSISVDIDGPTFVGGICHWPPNLFEFQFNDIDSGDVIFLETVNLENLKDIADYVEIVLSKIDRREKGSG